MYNINDIAHWFLQNTNDVTNKKLQKLAYYAYAWYLTLNNDNADDLQNRFFENSFEAWVHGAVSPQLYAEYKGYGSGYIPAYNGSLPDFSADELDILEQVKEVYGQYNGNQLEAICHQEAPWRDARKGLSAYEPSHNKITDRAIFIYYIQQVEE